MATTLVTGGTGFIGSHVVRQLAARGDRLRLLIREGRDASHLDGIEFERADGDVTDRDSVRAAMDGVERVFHVAGKTSMRSADRERVFEVNVGGTRNVMEEALRAGVVRVVHTSSAGAVGPARPEGTADESQPFTAGRLGIAYINAKHDAEGVAMSVAAKGLPLVVVNPTFVLGPDDPTGTSNRLVRRLLLRRIPAYIDGGPQHRRRPRRRPRPPAGRRARPRGRALPARRSQLHPAAALCGPEPHRGRAAAAAEAARTRAAGERRGAQRAGLPVPAAPDEVRSGMQWWTYRNDKAVGELGFAPRPHEETLEETVAWQLEQLGPRAKGTSSPTPPCEAPGRPSNCFPSGDGGRHLRAAPGAVPLSHADQLPLSLRRRRPRAQGRGRLDTAPSACHTAATSVPRSSS